MDRDEPAAGRPQHGPGATTVVARCNLVVCVRIALACGVTIRWARPRSDREKTQPDGTFIVDNPVQLPDVLDVLVVGGGPFGTAAAFRLKELGLAALVIDHDDLMKRIRDYAKDKQILPDYGGGDRMQFPDGGALIRSLWFEPIDKDVMCSTWKGLYRKHSVPAQVGVEMLGLERDGAAWRAKCWNHNTKADQVFRAKHVILALGRGVPRKIEVTGDLRGMAFSFKDASGYVSGPALVIGGGTSAAEAVIAISSAKAHAGDKANVYWSYRGDKMPKVSKALADVFFDAFVVNGNVRYLPNSEPISVVGDGDEARLSIRTARKLESDQPSETVHLEFKKPLCVACIGEDIPEQLLSAIGAPLVTGGPQNKKRIVVTPLLETRQTNVYLAGDVLSPAYFEAKNFEDPSAFEEMKRRGNVKAAMRDGVFLAEVIAQKLSGKAEIRVDLKFAAERAPAAPAAAAAPPAAAAETPASAPAAAPADKPAPLKPPSRGDCVLVSILPTGVEANEFPVKPLGLTTIGRVGADVSFPDDAAMSDRQAIIEASDTGYRVRPDGGARGVYLLPGPERVVPMEPGMLMHAGRQWFIAGDAQEPASLLHYESGGGPPRRYGLQEGATIVGRESPEITVARDDGALSRRHFAVVRRGNRLGLKDLGSANGTLIQIDRPVLLSHGDCLVVGQQKLRFSDEREAERPKATVKFDTGNLKQAVAEARAAAPPPPRPAAAVAQASAASIKSPVPPAVPAPAPAAVPAAALAAGSGPSVTFQTLGKTAPCPKGKSICEAAEAAHIKLDADCHQGVCGMDPVRVISGAEFLSPMSDGEKGTLEDLCSLKAGEHRLACMARVSGPVVVEPVKQ